jgi:hypothetical protein
MKSYFRPRCVDRRGEYGERKCCLLRAALVLNCRVKSLTPLVSILANRLARGVRQNWMFITVFTVIYLFNLKILNELTKNTN